MESALNSGTKYGRLFSCWINSGSPTALFVDDMPADSGDDDFRKIWRMLVITAVPWSQEVLRFLGYQEEGELWIY